MGVTAEDIHEFLLANQPEDADHNQAECAMCLQKASTQEESVSTDNMLTQEQHEQLLASAVEKATTAAAATVDAEVLSLNEQLDEAKSALAAKDEEIETLKSSIDERAEEDRLEALAAERVAQVKEVASFSDEQVESRRAAWAKMDEDDFVAYVEDIKAVAAVKSDDDDGAPKTGLDGTRETAGDKGNEQSVISDFLLGTDVAVAETL
jgi:hypothetical protein